ncbi:MAG: hypothetical protein H7Z42_16360 [Roseiflexaceae bacterium]|nr:hypothetical protein [Roseiflexaceae bacterium]
MSSNSRTGQVATTFPAQRSWLPDVIGLGGAIAGLAGGAAMALVGVLTSLILGGNIWIEPKAIAAPFFGPTVMRPGFEFGPVLVGTILHFATAALLGAIYSIVTRRILKLPSDIGVPVLAGLIYGFFIWAVAYFLLLPLVNTFLRAQYAPAFIMQHLVYGVVLGLVYATLRPNPYALTAPRARE